MIYDQKSTFLWKFQYTHFCRTKCFLETKSKNYIFFCHYYLKAPSFQNTLELYHDQRIWGRNFCENLDNAVSLPPKNALFLIKNPFCTMKKGNHHYKWLIPLEGYDQDNFFCLVLGCQHILIWALDFFKRSGHHIMPIS